MRLPTTFSVYMGRSFLASFAMVLAFIGGLILLFEVIELMRRSASRDDMGFSVILTMGLLKLPQMLHVVLPFAVMLGGMIAFWRLTRSQELVVARAAGVSVWQILGPVLVIVFGIGVLDVAAVNPLAAALHERFERMEDQLFSYDGNPLSLSENGLWLREVRDDGQVVVMHADQVRQEGPRLLLRQVTIFLFDGADRFSHRLEAEEARLADGRFLLSGAWEMHPGQPSERHDSYPLPTSLTLTKIHDNFSASESLSFWELPQFIEFFESSGFSAHRQKLYWQSLLASPLLSCAMLLVAAAFALNPNVRAGGALLRVIGGVGAGLLVYFFSNVAYALGVSAKLPLAMAAWSPPIVTSLLGLGLLFHLEDG